MLHQDFLLHQEHFLRAAALLENASSQSRRGPEELEGGAESRRSLSRTSRIICSAWKVEIKLPISWEAHMTRSGEALRPPPPGGRTRILPAESGLKQAADSPVPPSGSIDQGGSAGAPEADEPDVCCRSGSLTSSGAVDYS